MSRPWVSGAQLSSPWRRSSREAEASRMPLGPVTPGEAVNGLSLASSILSPKTGAPHIEGGAGHQHGRVRRVMQFSVDHRGPLNVEGRRQVVKTGDPDQIFGRRCNQRFCRRLISAKSVIMLRLGRGSATVARADRRDDRVAPVDGSPPVRRDGQRTPQGRVREHRAQVLPCPRPHEGHGAARLHPGRLQPRPHQILPGKHSGRDGASEREAPQGQAPPRDMDRPSRFTERRHRFRRLRARRRLGPVPTLPRSTTVPAWRITQGRLQHALRRPSQRLGWFRRPCSGARGQQHA